MDINELFHNLRSRLIEYRWERRDVTVSKHINAIDIVVCLVEYALEDNRAIPEEEEKWFDAAYQLSYVLDGSEWKDLSDLYCKLVEEVKKRDFFR